MTSIEIIKPPQQSQLMPQKDFQSFLEGYLGKYLMTITRIGGPQAPGLLYELLNPTTEISESLLQAKLDGADTKTGIYPVPDSGTTHYELQSERSLVSYLAAICGFIINTNEEPKNEEILDVGLTDGLDEPLGVIAIDTKKAPLIINLSELIVSFTQAYEIKSDLLADLLLRRLKESPPVMKTQSTIDKAIADLGQTPPHISKQVLPNLLRSLIEEEKLILKDLVEGQTLPGLLAKIKKDSPKIEKLKDMPGPESTPKSSQPSTQDQREAESQKAIRERAETVDIDLTEDVEYTAKFYFNILSNVLVDLLKPLFANSAILEQCSEATKTQRNSLKLDIPCVSKRSLLPALVYLVKNGSINIKEIDSADENLKDKIDTILKSFNLTSKKLAKAPKTEKIDPLNQTLSNQGVEDVDKKENPHQIVRVIKSSDLPPSQQQPSAQTPNLPETKPKSPILLNRKQQLDDCIGQLQPVDLGVLAERMPQENNYINPATKEELARGKEAEEKIVAILKEMNITVTPTIPGSPLDEASGDIIIMLIIPNSKKISCTKIADSGWLSGAALLTKLKDSQSIDSNKIPSIELGKLYAILQIDVTSGKIGIERKFKKAVSDGLRDGVDYRKSLCVIAPSASDKTTKENLQGLINHARDSINESLHSSN